mmetsp:Transcript_7690/g.10245  ORF Transcript_7690/g.10245 Transcript_7690/m.10245 type:complete len:117 (-) Transcript_7690:812-1162(-)
MYCMGLNFHVPTTKKKICTEYNCMKVELSIISPFLQPNKVDLIKMYKNMILFFVLLLSFQFSVDPFFDNGIDPIPARIKLTWPLLQVHDRINRSSTSNKGIYINRLLCFPAFVIPI